MEWRNVFTPPFELDGGILIYDVENRFCLNTLVDEDLTKDILNKLNGTHSKTPRNGKFYLTENKQKVMFKGKVVFLIRAWGRLTGTGGGMGLPAEEAARLQDAFADWIIKTLNN